VCFSDEIKQNVIDKSNLFFKNNPFKQLNITNVKELENKKPNKGKYNFVSNELNMKEDIFRFSELNFKKRNLINFDEKINFVIERNKKFQKSLRKTKIITDRLINIIKFPC